jgi:hypothetical protein
MSSTAIREVVEQRLFANTQGFKLRWYRRILNSFPAVLGLWVLNKAVCPFLFWAADTRVSHVSLFDAYYWGSTTSSTTGYGDILPHTHTSKLIAMWYMETTSWIVLALGALFVIAIIVSKQQMEAEDDLNDVDGKTEWNSLMTLHIHDELVRGGYIRPAEPALLDLLDTHLSHHDQQY